MTTAIKAPADLVLLSASGEVIAEPEQRDEAISQDVVRVRARVFNVGYNRNGISFRPSTLQRMQRTAKNIPALYHHDVTREEGVVERAHLVRAPKEGDGGDGSIIGLDADFAFDAPSALASLRRGVSPRFSIHPQPEDAEATLRCAECGEDQLTGGCIHPWLGGGLEASGRWEMAEISRTPTPAVPGTGVREVLTQLASVVAPGVRSRWEVLMSEAQRGRPETAPAENKDVKGAPPATPPPADPEVVSLSERKIANLEAEIASLKAKADRTETLETQVSELRERAALAEARRIAVESREVALTHMRRGALRLEEQAAIELRAENPELFDRILAAVPDNPAFSAGTRLSPHAGEVPDSQVDPHDFVALAARCDRIARETGRDYEDVLREEREKMQAVLQSQGRRGGAR